MTRVVEIERAVESLSSDELFAFRDWFERFQAERFDRAIDEDVRAGHLHRFAAEARLEAVKGVLRDL